MMDSNKTQSNMKAPDKIYSNGTGTFSTMPVFDESDRVEYIRKDILLKWAKERMSHYPDAEKGIGWGQFDAFRQVIEKIESL